MTRELAAFEEAAGAVEETLDGMPDDAWQRQGLGAWSVAELVAHLVRAADRPAAYLDRDPGGTEPAADRISYWQFDLEAAAPAIAERARGDAADRTPADLVDAFRRGWRTSAERARALPADHLLTTLRGPMRLDEYLATRVVELVVHHMDLRAALDLPPVVPPTSGALTVEILEALLGSPRPRNFGRDRFIRAATGRLSVDDPRFPVLR